VFIPDNTHQSIKAANGVRKNKNIHIVYTRA